RIVVALGDRFPLIGAHKVLAAYGCLVPRLATGRFDPTRDRAVLPSTRNYCRRGVDISPHLGWRRGARGGAVVPSTGSYCRVGFSISRLLGCRGVAVLPEGMSRERFAWLERWVAD